MNRLRRPRKIARLLLSIVFAVVTAACNQSQQTSPPPPPETEPETLSNPSTQLSEIIFPIGQKPIVEGGRIRLATDDYARITQPGTVVVGTEPFRLSGSLQPAPRPAWYEDQMLLEGVEPTETRFDSGFELAIPAGAAGDSFRLTFREIIHPDGSTGSPFTVTFTRQAHPSATLAYRSPEGWVPTSTYIPTGGAPLHLRLTFTSPMNRDSVAEALQLSTGTGGIQAMTWRDDQTLELTVADPEPLLYLNLIGARGANGLNVAGTLPYLYTGEPAHLVAVDPVTGTEERTGPDLPPEISTIQLSPDRSEVRFLSLERRAELSSPWDAPYRPWSLDLQSGKLSAVAVEGYPGRWSQFGSERMTTRRNAENHLVISHTGPNGVEQVLTEGKELPKIWGLELSPDGNRLALFVPVDDPNLPDPYYPVRLVMLDLTTLARHEFPGTLRWFAPGKDGIVLYGPTWSPDSRKLLINQDLDDGVAIMVADFDAGTMRTIAMNLDGVERAWRSPITWTPDSRKVLVGSVLLEAETGAVLHRLAEAPGPVLWHPDGERFLYPARTWGEVALLTPATGERLSLGEGRPVGWLADGRALILRWPDADLRWEDPW